MSIIYIVAEMNDLGILYDQQINLKSNYCKLSISVTELFGFIAINVKSFSITVLIFFLMFIVTFIMGQ